jgi:hypothetical protein
MIPRSSATYCNIGLLAKLMLLGGSLAGGVSPLLLGAQTAPDPAKSVAVSTPTRYQPSRFSKRAGEYYGLIWGVDSLSVKTVESGELIRFSYRVLNGAKAAVLNDKNTEAFLNAPEKRVQLVVPSLEKVGKLRQSNSPEPGKTYWMAFSNPGRTVKRGDRVDVVIGQFHAQGLVVE